MRRVPEDGDSYYSWGDIQDVNPHTQEDRDASELSEEAVKEGERRFFLDRLYGFEGDRPELPSVQRMIEHHEDGVKSLCRRLAERAEEAWQQEGVFVLWREDEGELGIAAYADDETAVVETGEHWLHFDDILEAREKDVGRKGFDPVTQMPPPLNDPKYRIELNNTEYVKIRGGGVIGPGTVGYHDEFDEFESWI